MKGIRGLFAVVALSVSALSATEYDPDPKTGDKLREQIDQRVDAVAFMRKGLAGLLDRLQSSAPDNVAGDKAGPTCLTLANDANFGFNYGPGQVSVNLVDMQRVAAREEKGRLVPVAASPEHFFSTARDLIQSRIGMTPTNPGDDVLLPPGTFMGCSENVQELRAAQKNINNHLTYLFTRRMEGRIHAEIDGLYRKLAVTGQSGLKHSPLNARRP
jgi:hypothetical protein